MPGELHDSPVKGIVLVARQVGQSKREPPVLPFEQWYEKLGKGTYDDSPAGEGVFSKDHCWRKLPHTSLVGLGVNCGMGVTVTVGDAIHWSDWARETPQIVSSLPCFASSLLRWSAILPVPGIVGALAIVAGRTCIDRRCFHFQA